MDMNKESALQAFEQYVSAGKASFFRKYGMDFVMGHREGPWLYDLDGKKRLFNLHCNGGVFNLGHRNSEIIQTLHQALDEVDIGNHHLMSRERAALAKQLSSLMPGDLNTTIFSVGGGEAVDLALKIAMGHTGRQTIISASGGYHGHTGLALAAGDEQYRSPFGIRLGGFKQVPFNDIAAMEAIVDESTAAVILETIPATLGMVVPDPDYLTSVRNICDKTGTLLILDEVQSGLGRTGKLWAFEHFNIVPDMVIIGKGLSGGIYPIAATIIRNPLDEIFRKEPFIHISTFGGAEPGCRVARKVLEITLEHGFLDHVNTLAETMTDRLHGLQKRHTRFFKGIRQKGLMMGLELRDPLSGPALTKAAYDQDLLMVYANNDPSVCQLLPPLTIDESDIDFIIDRLDDSLKNAAKLRTLLKTVDGAKRLMGKFTSRSKQQS